MCRHHWFALPKKIRDAIWLEYRHGQEQDKRPSVRYLAVQQLACAHSVFSESASKALEHIATAAHYSRDSIAKGFGDPLEGLKGPQ